MVETIKPKILLPQPMLQPSRKKCLADNNQSQGNLKLSCLCCVSNSLDVHSDWEAGGCEYAVVRTVIVKRIKGLPSQVVFTLTVCQPFLVESGSQQEAFHLPHKYIPAKH